MTNLSLSAPQLTDRLRDHFIRNKGGWIVFVVGSPLIFWLSRNAGGGFGFYGESITQLQFTQLGLTLLAALAGFLIGAFAVVLLYLFGRFRDVALALLALLVLFFVLRPGAGDPVAVLIGFVAFLAGLLVAKHFLFPSGSWRPTILGSAKWADFDHIRTAGLFSENGFWLGSFEAPKRRRHERAREFDIRYNGDRHLLTVAPTRAGKGVSAIIPNLLTYPGSALVVDPKGENALITALARHRMGQRIHIVDPWGLAAPRFRIASAHFNPLDWLVDGDPDINENAMLLADALIVKNENSQDTFWDEEAKALLMGIILHVATDVDERDNRHLGRVRDMLMLDSDETRELFTKMYKSQNAVVSGAGARCLQKDGRLLSNVMAAVQSHTHFLDSPRIRDSLSRSDFAFEQLKSGAITVYLVLPADRLNAFGRWLRLLIQQAITVNARNISERPLHPILFLLDEMPSLGRLAMVEQAYGLMAGFGMQIWGIVQNLSQLKRIYGDGWETFVANSGVLQYFGSRDKMSAEYFSKLCGVTTLISISTALASAFTSGYSGSTTTTTTTRSNSQRQLAYADELMTLPKDRQLILVENNDPISARKIRWYEHPALASLGINLHQLQTHAPDPSSTTRPTQTT